MEANKEHATTNQLILDHLRRHGFKRTMKVFRKEASVTPYESEVDTILEDMVEDHKKRRVSEEGEEKEEKVEEAPVAESPQRKKKKKSKKHKKSKKSAKEATRTKRKRSEEAESLIADTHAAEEEQQVEAKEEFDGEQPQDAIEQFPSPQKKRKKKKKTSANRSFSRIKDHNPTFLTGDHRMADNSYAATYGNSGWGAAAAETLGRVKGKGFRHEKTKKKRGSYRGGKLDIHAVNAVQFESSSE